MTRPECPDCGSHDLRRTSCCAQNELLCKGCDTIWLDEDCEPMTLERFVAKYSIVDPTVTDIGGGWKRAAA